MNQTTLTILAIPKPFCGHIGVIQRNAITSWTRLRPRPEIYLFGDEQGVAEMAGELRIHHIGDLARSKFGTPMLDDLMLRGRDLARTPLLAYVNSDIILLQECLDAVVKIRERFSTFLAVAYRLNIELMEALNFEADGETKLRCEILPNGVPGDPTAIDLFVFTPDVYEKVPPFAIGRGWFDQWLIKEAHRQRIPLLDVTHVARAIHQNHEYAHIGGSLQGVLSTEEGQRNLGLYGGTPHAFSLLNATHELLSDGTMRRVRFRRERAAVRNWLWNNFIRPTAGLRAKIGMQRTARAASRENGTKA
jgi:hypothetical protein